MEVGEKVFNKLQFTNEGLNYAQCSKPGPSGLITKRVTCSSPFDVCLLFDKKLFWSDTTICCKFAVHIQLLNVYLTLKNGKTFMKNLGTWNLPSINARGVFSVCNFFTNAACIVLWIDIAIFLATYLELHCSPMITLCFVWKRILSMWCVTNDYFETAWWIFTCR